MLDNRSLIGLTTLSTLFDINKYERTDILLPFIRYSISKKYKIGDLITISDICDCLDKNFGFIDVPPLIVERGINKLKKKGQMLNKITNNNNVMYQVVKIDEENVEFLNRKMEDMSMNLEFLTSKLRYYFSSKGISYNIEETKKKLFEYMESHGFDEYYLGKNEIQMQPKRDRDNFIIAEFYSENKDPSIKGAFEKLLSGIILMNTVYLPPTIDYTENAAKFDDLYIYVDTALLMGLLGLKTIEENLKAQSLYKLKPPFAKLMCFMHNLDELENILAKSKNGQSHQKVEYFLENDYTENDIDKYIFDLEDIIKRHSIEIDKTSTYTTLSEKMRYTTSFSTEKLSDYLRKYIPNYNRKSNQMLDNDIKSIQYIDLIRKGRSAKVIEKCKAIFVTSNFNLTKYSNKFFNDTVSIKKYNLIISTTDLVSILWAKSGMQSENAKDILMQFSQIADIDFTYDFKSKLKHKVQTFLKDGKINQERALTYLDYQVLSVLYRDHYSEIDEIDIDVLDTTVESVIQQKVEEEFGLREKSIKEREKRVEAKDDFNFNKTLNYFKKKARHSTDRIMLIIRLVFWGLYILLTLGFNTITIISILTFVNVSNVILVIIIAFVVLTISVSSFLITKKYKRFESSFNRIDFEIYKRRNLKYRDEYDKTYTSNR